MNVNSLLSNARTLHGSEYLWGAHHPHCDRHGNHLLWIAGHPFCMGCVCMYTGMAVALPVALVINWNGVSLAGWAGLIALLLLPTIGQFKIQYKPYKMTSRFLLGCAVSLYWLAGFLWIMPPVSINIWLFRLLLVPVFYGLYRLIRGARERHIQSPCTNCPLGVYPTCEWNLPRLMAAGNDAELVAILSGDSLENMIVK